MSQPEESQLRALKRQWRTVPDIIRKPVIFIVGGFFLLVSALTGWLPGPGGIPLFLVGIAILSTEFRWAKRVRDIVMLIVDACLAWYRQNRVLGMILLTIGAVIGAIALTIMIHSVFLS